MKLNLDFRKGWNPFILWMRKTPAGFGCLIGAEEAKVRILNVLAPFQERKGQAGWVFSEAMTRMYTRIVMFPILHQSEALSGLHWLPTYRMERRERGMPACERLFGIQPGSMAYAWSKVVLPGPARAVLPIYMVQLQGR